MLQLFPFVVYLAAISSAVFLGALWILGELGPRSVCALLGCFLLAGYCQFLAGSAIVSTAGLVLQTTLAIYLVLRWRLSG